MSWILSKEGQTYLGITQIIEKVIVEQLMAFREELSEGQIKLIADCAAREAAKRLIDGKTLSSFL